MPSGIQQRYARPLAPQPFARSTNASIFLRGISACPFTLIPRTEPLFSKAPVNTPKPQPATVSETSVTADADTDTFEQKIEDTTFENVTGVFEGLEDNHTALFSFDRVEVVFFFEDPEVQTVLSEAVIGSTYTLSYQYDAEQGLNIIYEISE